MASAMPLRPNKTWGLPLMAVVAGTTPKMGHMAHDFSKNQLLGYWEMTQACGLACKYCRAEAMPATNPFELNTDESKRSLRQSIDFGNLRRISQSTS